MYERKQTHGRGKGKAHNPRHIVNPRRRRQRATDAGDDDQAHDGRDPEAEFGPPRPRRGDVFWCFVLHVGGGRRVGGRRAGGRMRDAKTMADGCGFGGNQMMEVAPSRGRCLAGASPFPAWCREILGSATAKSKARSESDRRNCRVTWVLAPLRGPRRGGAKRPDLLGPSLLIETLAFRVCRAWVWDFSGFRIFTFGSFQGHSQHLCKRLNISYF